jgi:glycosyltransferase involved in cell wall biosynthesis
MVVKKISIVVPTMNEEISISKFLDWCETGLNNLGMTGEVVLLDSSDDDTQLLAQSKGAKVIKVSEKGLGVAYSKAQNVISGDYVILGDADCTYDFQNLQPFVEKLDEGFDLVIGNRFKGKIQKGAMPIHHQYFGSPGTSLFFKYGLGIPTGDIHCGMRAMTAKLYNSLPFLESGWEYATEMIVSARNLDAKITEVPIEFFKEPEGRVSHHKRTSWTSPFKAGWGTLRVTVTYLIDRVFVVPGALILGSSTLINLLTSVFRERVLEVFKIGLLTQSILMFASSIGAFMLTTGLLARFAYRRKLSSLRHIAGSKLSSRLFSLLIATTMVQIILSFAVLYSWLNGLKIDSMEYVYDSSLISNWLSFTSFYLCTLSLSIASLIGNHAQKFQR